MGRREQVVGMSGENGTSKEKHRTILPGGASEGESPNRLTLGG